MQEFSVFTIPHTGTNFVHKFLEILNLKDRCYRNHCPSADVLPDYIRDKINNLPVIVTARDPYLSVFHWITMPYNTDKSIDNMVKRWNLFVDILPTMNYCIIDVGAEQKYKRDQLINAVSHIGYNPDDYKEQIISYAGTWKPLNVTKNEMKLKYAETGELPKGYDWSKLDSAVEWYKNLPTNTHS